MTRRLFECDGLTLNCLLLHVFINSETLIPNPLEGTSSTDRQTFFFPSSISEMFPRSIPKLMCHFDLRQTLSLSQTAKSLAESDQ